MFILCLCIAAAEILSSQIHEEKLGCAGEMLLHTWPSADEGLFLALLQKKKSSGLLPLGFSITRLKWESDCGSIETFHGLKLVCRPGTINNKTAVLTRDTRRYSSYFPSVSLISSENSGLE